MKIWRNKFLKRMIIVITVVYLIMNCFVPNYVFANKAKSDFKLAWEDFWAGVDGLLWGTVAALSGVGALGVVITAAGVTIGLLKVNESIEEGDRNGRCAWTDIGRIYGFYCSYC